MAIGGPDGRPGQKFGEPTHLMSIGRGGILPRAEVEKKNGPTFSQFPLALELMYSPFIPQHVSYALPSSLLPCSWPYTG
jgi:hypothetical protein